MPEISIIMPCFNVEKYIERSFESILNQTMDSKNIEVIMVDDCSTDNTKNIIKEYDEKYSNFKAVYHKTNSGGCAIPRNSGLNVATGKYIMFLDPDDEFVPDMCETMYNKIEETHVNLVKCNFERVYPTYSTLDYPFDKSLNEIKINCETELPPNEFSACTGIYKKSFLDEKNIKFADLKNGEELLFSLTNHVNTDVIIFLNHYHGYKYYTNETMSHASRPSKDNLDALLNSFYLIKELLESKNRPDIIKLFYSGTPIAFFFRLMYYDGDKKEYLKKYYELEKNLNVELTMEYKWLDILNKLLMKKQFTLCVWYMNILKFIRDGPLVEIYRKLTMKT